MSSVTSYACLQKLALRDVSIALNCQLHVRCARMGAQSSAGRVLVNLVSRDRIGQYYLAGRDGHQIHPRRVDWIDSVKINPSLAMMRECYIQLRAICSFPSIWCARATEWSSITASGTTMQQPRHDHCKGCTE